MNTLSVSSYSVREQLGPIVFSFTDPEGNDQRYEFPYPKELSLSEFPARAKDDFAVEAIETVAFQFSGLDDPEIDRFAENLAANGIRLLNVAVDVGDLLETDDAKRAADVELLKRWIDRFAEMGSAFVRVNPGSLFNPYQGEPPAHLIAALVGLGQYANSRGTRLLVENHGGLSSDPVWMNRLLDEVGRDNLGLLLDLGNFEVLLQPMMAMLFGGAGEPVAIADLFADVDLTPLYEGIEALAARAELVHVKSHDVAEDGAVGVVDLERALGILAEHGYTGPLTIEYEGNGGDPWAKSARVLEITRTFVEREMTTAGGR